MRTPYQLIDEILLLHGIDVKKARFEGVNIYVIETSKHVPIEAIREIAKAKYPTDTVLIKRMVMGFCVRKVAI